MNALLVTTLFLSTAGTFTACSQKDYDQDIANLQAQIDANTKAINQINTLVTSGCVITKVEKSSNGVTISLSNGQSYEITNGTNGKDAVVWSIGTDGYWYKDGTKTNYLAVGQKGDTGTSGAIGNYYKPNSDTGCFDLYASDGTFKEHTTISWKATTGAITAFDNGLDITLYSVADVNGNLSPIVIAKTNHLRSMVFIPDHGYAKGLAIIPYYSIPYNTLSPTNSDNSNESWSGNSKAYINETGEARYHINPTNASEDYVKSNLTFVHEAGDVQSRSLSSTDFKVAPQFDALANGILSVKVNIKGTPATDDFVTPIALHTTYGKPVDVTTVKNDTVEGVTSDYAILYREDITNIALGDVYAKRGDDNPHYQALSNAANDVYYYYRTSMNGENYLYTPTITNKAWDSMENDATSCEYKVAYNSSIDLSEYVGIIGTNTGKAQVIPYKDLGLKLQFDLVKNYKTGNNATDQSLFATISSDGLLTPQFNNQQTQTCIGRTPIVRVKVLDGNNVVRVAYIKVNIVAVTTNPGSSEYTFNLPNQTIQCDGVTVPTNATQMNLLYAKVGLSKSTFDNTYTSFDEDHNASNNVGTVTYVKNDQGSSETNVLQWKLTYDEMLNNAGKLITNKVIFSTANHATLSVTLNANISDNTFELLRTNYQQLYWGNNSYCSINAQVPGNGNDCSITTTINSIFRDVTSVVGATNMDNLRYSFVNAGDFTAQNTDDKLTSTLLSGGETIATITNDGHGGATITYNKNSDIAKELINVGNVDAYIAAKVYLCGTDKSAVPVNFNGNTSFQVKFLRPVTIASVSGKEFTDGVDEGAVGSYITLGDLINPTDWRGYSFKANPDYWNYYGVSNISVDLVNATANLNGVTQNVKDVGLQLTIPDGNTKDGFLRYHNSGKPVEEDFDINVKVAVKYIWGTINSDWVTIHVNKTVKK